MAAPNNSPSGWVGWVYFSGIMMMILGGMQAIEGLAGLFRNKFYVVSASHLLVFNYRAWGWLDLVLGIVIFMAGYELFRGAVWARVVAVVLAGLSVLANMAFIDAYPLWSILVIIVDVVIIYSILVHGEEVKKLN